MQHSSVETQINVWLNEYMAQYPELLQKQLDDYASLNEEWRVTASERIFPALPERLYTRGMGWSWIIHVVLDTVIYFFIAVAID